MNIKDNNHKLAARVEYCLAKFKESNPALADKMSWHWCEVHMNTRLRGAVGKCLYYRGEDKLVIQFSEDLFNKLSEGDKTDTVGHELAHAVCFRLKCGENHNAGWKRVAIAMGSNGDRCKVVERGVVKRNLIKRWVVTDKTKLFVVTKKRAENLRFFPKYIPLGVIQVDTNSKEYKWVQVVNEDVRTITPLKVDLGWKLLA